MVLGPAAHFLVTSGCVEGFYEARAGEVTHAACYCAWVVREGFPADGEIAPDDDQTYRHDG